ncbi:MAG TPA: dienelactone hydrolase family protein [Gammaproteobacteria bacterium]|jgi:phospholipase/carboxylesterase|nr:dienelactone hydrolase family protein [Gammaproteobacteria bacterium]
MSSTPPLLPTVEIATGDSPELAIIWLHGLGADGHDFEPIVPELGLRFPARFIFPHAPIRPITVNGGMEMRAWYDIVGFGLNVQQDAAGIRESAAAVTRLIDREIARGIAASRIVLAGFSQGGAIALHAALREPRPLAGVMALSTYLPLGETLPAERSAANAGVPIFLAHGTADPLLPLALAEGSRRTLEALGYAVEFHVYPMPHSVCVEEIAAIAVWLARRVA